MTDEEFDEDEEYDPEEARIPVKNILKALGLMGFVVTGMLIVNYFWQDPYLNMLGFMLVCVGSCLAGYKGKKRKKVKHVYSLFKCTSSACGIKELREFKEGDYVFKRGGPCWKCDDGTMEIAQIFSVELEDKDKIKISTPDASKRIEPPFP